MVVKQSATLGNSVIARVVAEHDSMPNDTLRDGGHGHDRNVDHVAMRAQSVTDDQTGLPPLSRPEIGCL